MPASDKIDNIKTLIEEFEKIKRDVKYLVIVANEGSWSQPPQNEKQTKINDLNLEIDVFGSKLPYITRRDLKRKDQSHLNNIFVDSSRFAILRSEYYNIYNSYKDIYKSEVTPRVERGLKLNNLKQDTEKLKRDVNRMLTKVEKLLTNKSNLYKEIEDLLNKINNFHSTLDPHNMNKLLDNNHIDNCTRKYHSYLDTTNKFKKLMKTTSQNNSLQQGLFAEGRDKDNGKEIKKSERKLMSEKDVAKSKASSRSFLPKNDKSFQQVQNTQRVNCKLR